MKKLSLIIILLVVTVFQCDKDYEDYYVQALNYISTDNELIEMLRDHNLYEPALLYSNSELVYKVYTERPGTFFELFRNELELLGKNHRDYLNMEKSIDNALADYTISDTARVKVFFSEKVDNVIASEVFFRRELFKYEGFDDYHGNSMFNTAMKYMFVFEEGRIDTVFKKVQQYE